MNRASANYFGFNYCVSLSLWSDSTYPYPFNVQSTQAISLLIILINYVQSILLKSSFPYWYLILLYFRLGLIQKYFTSYDMLALKQSYSMCTFSKMSTTFHFECPESSEPTNSLNTIMTLKFWKIILSVSNVQGGDLGCLVCC